MITTFDLKCDSPRIIPSPSDWDYIVPEIPRGGIGIESIYAADRKSQTPQLPYLLSHFVVCRTSRVIGAAGPPEADCTRWLCVFIGPPG